MQQQGARPSSILVNRITTGVEVFVSATLNGSHPFSNVFFEIDVRDVGGVSNMSGSQIVG